MKSLSKFGFLLPLLTAVFIVLSLWSVNATRTTLLDVAIPLTTAILSSLLLWGLAHLLPMLGRKSLPPPMLDNINIFAAVLVVVFLLWSVLTPWVAMGILIAASLVLTIFSLKKAIPALIVFMLIVNVVAVGEGTFQQMDAVKAAAAPSQSSNNTNVVSSNDASSNPAATKLPDIYFIIPDRMPSIAAELEDGFSGATAFQQSLEESWLSGVAGFIKFGPAETHPDRGNTDDPDAAVCHIGAQLRRTYSLRYFLQRLNSDD